MTLQTSGPISVEDINVELRRVAAAAFSLGGAAERELAAKPSGQISFVDFLGKSATYVANITTNATNLNLNGGVFTNDQWVSAADKIVNIGNGVTLGSFNVSVAALIVNSGMGGKLYINNNGKIYGAGGAANSGEGGPALAINSAVCIIDNTIGEIRGGGGGGGVGGRGGQGGGTSCQSCNETNDSINCSTFPVYGGAGGAGGAGGVGQGYGQNATGGSAGSAGSGGNLFTCYGSYQSGAAVVRRGGTGGTGGTGGGWGATGATGGTGASGESGSGGLAGAAGGAGGRAVALSGGSVTFTNLGAVSGAYT